MIKGRISFILLTYRNFEGVTDTLDSVFSQNYPDIEIIISDDCSPDANEKLDEICRYVDKHKGSNITEFKMRRGELNVGTVKSLNLAIKMSTGEYIKILGAEDTFVDNNTLTKYKLFLDKSGCLICCSKLQGVTPTGEIKTQLASCEDNYDALRSYSPLELRDRLFKRNCLPAPAFFFKRELFEKYGYYPESIRLIEDYPYWLMLCSQNVRFAFCDERMINYKLSGISSAGSYSKAFMEDMMKIYEIFIFPYDKRFGILQPAYNHLKKEGLGAYMAIAKWKEYSVLQKTGAYIRYGVFFLYIKLSNLKYK